MKPAPYSQRNRQGALRSSWEKVQREEKREESRTTKFSYMNYLEIHAGKKKRKPSLTMQAIT